MPLPGHLVLAALAALLTVGPSPLEAQDAVLGSIGVSPYVGIGPIFEHGSHVAWSGNAFLEIDVTRTPLRWTLFGSVRGLGAACADGCDLSGQSLGVGMTYLPGSVGLGVGMGMLHQSGSWYAQPQAMASADRGPFRIQLRLEVPQGGYGVFVPVVMGVRLPVG